jgi:hypothetical protein
VIGEEMALGMRGERRELVRERGGERGAERRVARQEIGREEELRPDEGTQADRRRVPARAVAVPVDPVAQQLGPLGRREPRRAQPVVLLEMESPERTERGVLPVDGRGSQRLVQEHDAVATAGARVRRHVEKGCGGARRAQPRGRTARSARPPAADRVCELPGDLGEPKVTDRAQQAREIAEGHSVPRSASARA